MLLVTPLQVLRKNQTAFKRPAPLFFEGAGEEARVILPGYTTTKSQAHSASVLGLDVKGCLRYNSSGPRLGSGLWESGDTANLCLCDAPADVGRGYQPVQGTGRTV